MVGPPIRPRRSRSLPALKPPLTFDAAKEPELSPLLHVKEKSAPILLIHGDKDVLVPISQSKNMLEALEKGKANGKLVIVEGGGHVFSPKENQDVVLPALLEWFDKNLAEKK